MSQVTCTSCGREQSGSRARCIQCDLPLEPSNRPGFVFPLATAVRAVLLLGLLALFVLMTLSPEGQPSVAEEADLNRFYRNLVRMEHAVRQERTFQWTVREDVLNQYLAQVLERDRSDAPDSFRRLEQVWVEFDTGQARLVLIDRWGPLQIARQCILSTHESVGEGAPPLQVNGFLVGRVRLPGFLSGFLLDSIDQAFSGFSSARYVLLHVGRIRFDPEKAYLANP